MRAHGIGFRSPTVKLCFPFCFLTSSQHRLLASTRKDIIRRRGTTARASSSYQTVLTILIRYATFETKTKLNSSVLLLGHFGKATHSNDSAFRLVGEL